MREKIIGVLITLASIIIPFTIITIVFIFINKDEESDVIVEEPVAEVVEEQIDYREDGIWITYWDSVGAIKQLERSSKKYDFLSVFAAYFNDKDELFIPSQIEIFRKEQLSSSSYVDVKTYLTIVNDIESSKGNKSKDVEVLKRVFSTEEKMRKHVDDIVFLAQNNGYDGIEINYEALRKDYILWEKFSIFQGLLLEKAKENGLDVRIILEPSAPLDKIEIYDEIEYIVMCYNLYGKTTSAGPKADREFLIQMTEKMNTISANVGFALANGGYDFPENGVVTAVTYQEAIALPNSISAVRDKSSGALHFEYIDDSNIEHEVWYADQETIDSWEKCLREHSDGIITVWRMEIE